MNRRWVESQVCGEGFLFPHAEAGRVRPQVLVQGPQAPSGLADEVAAIDAPGSAGGAA